MNHIEIWLVGGTMFPFNGEEQYWTMTKENVIVNFRDRNRMEVFPRCNIIRVVETWGDGFKRTCEVTKEEA